MPKPGVLLIVYSSLSLQCISENTSCVTVSPTQQVINYTIKVVNPLRKSDYVVWRLRGLPQFTMLDDIKLKLCECLDIGIEELGYISTGHGLKGKLNPLSCDEDLTDMYAEYKGKRDILLWCSTPVEHNKSDASACRCKKRSLNFDESEEAPQPQSKKQVCAQKIKDVEAIASALKEKHGSAYSVEQFNAWAHMIHMCKHTSSEVPPALLYFGTQKKNIKGKRNSSTTSPAIIICHFVSR